MKKSVGTDKAASKPSKAGRSNNPPPAGLKSGLKAFDRPRLPLVPKYLREIHDLALTVWEDRRDAETFLHTPHALLGDKAPAVVARTPEGKERVRRILLALEYGLPV
jgi:hypothetical protein